MAYSFDWVDAFTSRPFGGNGCAVVHSATDLDDATCMAIVRETSLVECTFIGPSDIADVKVRYFLASKEIPFAGHPTIATVASLVDRGLVQGDRLKLETGAGIVGVTIDRSVSPASIEMTQIAPRFGPELAAEIVAGAVGLQVEDILGRPQIVSTGLPFCITLLKDHDALGRARIDPAGMARFRDAARSAETGVMEPYLVALGGATEAGDTFSRLLMEPPLPPEDPFTGSATGATAAWLWTHGYIASPGYFAEQGHGMGRPGLARVEVVGPRDAITGVKVAGQGYVLMRGDLLI